MGRRGQVPGERLLVARDLGISREAQDAWAARSHQPLHLRVPEILEGPGASSCLDAAEAAERVEADLVYLDPPYNQHSYLGNYHVWESLVRWDRPEVYGVAMKRTDVRERGSDFNRRGRILPALVTVLDRSDEGYVTLVELRELLARHGEVREASVEHPRHIGHKIGVYDLTGRRVGEPGHARNREHLFVVETGRIGGKSPSRAPKRTRKLAVMP